MREWSWVKYNINSDYNDDDDISLVIIDPNLYYTFPKNSQDDI